MVSRRDETKREKRPTGAGRGECACVGDPGAIWRCPGPRGGVGTGANGACVGACVCACACACACVCVCACACVCVRGRGRCAALEKGKSEPSGRPRSPLSVAPLPLVLRPALARPAARERATPPLSSTRHAQAYAQSSSCKPRPRTGPTLRLAGLSVGPISLLVPAQRRRPLPCLVRPRPALASPPHQATTRQGLVHLPFWHTSRDWCATGSPDARNPPHRRRREKRNWAEPSHGPPPTPGSRLPRVCVPRASHARPATPPCRRP